MASSPSGSAAFHGSAAGISRSQIVSIAATPDGGRVLAGVVQRRRLHLWRCRVLREHGGPDSGEPRGLDHRDPDGGGYWLLPSSAPRQPWGVPALSRGSSGPAVASVQQQLTNLGYWLGAVNGQFGDSTQQAVWALQKAAGISRSGVVDYATYSALSQGVKPQPLTTSGYVIEVNLKTDLVMFVNNGRCMYTLNTSTGGGYTYGSGTVAITPQGHFSIYRADNGLVVDSLGALWRPRYFTGGYAIHGDTNVPPVPVSHGCVRVSNEAINWIWTADLAPIGTPVWVY